MGAVIPSLSVDGFTTNNDAIVIKLFEHFKASDKSQSNFYDEVASLKYIINEHSDESDIKLLLEETLNTMYSAYYDRVDVSATVNSTGSKLDIYIDITVVSSTGTTHTLNSAMSGQKNNIASFDLQQDKIRG